LQVLCTFVAPVQWGAVGGYCWGGALQICAADQPRA
jgi:hypothetical protein